MKKTKPPATPADAILRAIELGGITQAELARRLGHNHPTTVSEWCLGKKQPGMDTFASAIAECADCEPRNVMDAMIASAVAIVQHKRVV